MCHKFFDSPSEKREKSLPLSPLPREMYKHLEKVRFQKELVQKKTQKVTKNAQNHVYPINCCYIYVHAYWTALEAYNST